MPRIKQGETVGQPVGFVRIPLTLSCPTMTVSHSPLTTWSHWQLVDTSWVKHFPHTDAATRHEAPEKKRIRCRGRQEFGKGGRYKVKALKERLTTTDYGEQLSIHPAVHIFLLLTFTAGVWFTFFGWTAPVQASLLWQVTNVHFVPLVMNGWGVGALLTTVTNTIGITMRRARLHNIAAMCGFMLWLYATVLYSWGALWFHVTVIALPNLAFWAYYYIATKRRTGR